MSSRSANGAWPELEPRGSCTVSQAVRSLYLPPVLKPTNTSTQFVGRSVTDFVNCLRENRMGLESKENVNRLRRKEKMDSKC